MQRVEFTKLKTKISLPDLIEVQTQSYQWFLQEGFKELLDEINPVEDFTGKVLTLEFGDHNLDQPFLGEIL